jgi:translation initiation factor IF-1
MHREHAIRLEGTVVEVLPRTLFRVRLVNGHQLLAFTPRRAREQAARLARGQTVTVEVSPYDFSKGRIEMEND